MAPHVGRTVLRLASAAPRLTTHSVHTVTALRALTTSAQSAKKATPQVEATIPATTSKKASAKSELTIKVKAKTPTKAAATKKAPAKAAAAKSTTAAAKKPAATKLAAKKPAAAKASTKATTDTKLTPLQVRRQREKLVNAAKREKLMARQTLEKEKKKAKIAQEKAKEKERAAKEKERAAKKKEREVEMKTKQKVRAQTMRERKLEKAREVRRRKNEREAAVKLKRKEAAKVKAQKHKVVEAKKDRLRTLKTKREEAQIGKIPTSRPLNMWTVYVQKYAVPGGKLINPGVLSSYKNLTEAEKATLQAEMVAINAERKEQYEKWKAAQSVEDLKKMNNARTWLKTNLHLKTRAPRIKDPRCDTRAVSPWSAFAIPRLKEDSGRPRPDVMREAAAAWKALSADEVQAYKQKADALTKVKQAALHL